MANYTGGCHCGHVKLELDGPPQAVCYCHCSICRKSSGAAFAFVGMWPPDKVRVVEGEPLATRKTSDHLERHRCPSCGASIYNAVRTKRFQFNNVLLPLLDERDDALKPTHHIYYADRVMDIPDDLPKFDAFGTPGR